MSRFFVVGCQRSGTTLLKLMLESHPDICCHDEHVGYQLLRGVQLRVENQSACSRIGFKAPRLTEQLLDAEWIDSDFPPCPSNYHGEPIVFAVRHPLDTITSMLLTGAGGTTWLRRWGAPSLDLAMQRRSGLRQLVEVGCKEAKTVRERECVVATVYWIHKLLPLSRYRSAGLPLLKVQYESLVQRQQEVAATLCRFLGVAWNEGVLRHHSVPHSELGPNGRAIGGTDPRRPIDGMSVGRWRSSLSEREVQTIQNVLKVSNDVGFRVDLLV